MAIDENQGDRSRKMLQQCDTFAIKFRQKPQIRVNYQQAEIGFRRHQSQQYLTKINTNLAVMALAIKDWAQAEQYFLHYIAGYTELGNDMWRLLTTDGLAPAALRRSDHLTRYGFLLSLGGRKTKVFTTAHNLFDKTLLWLIGVS